MTNEHFEPLVRRVGFGFAAIGTDEEFQEALKDPTVWHSLAGARTLARWVCKLTPVMYETVVRHHEPGQTVLVATGAAFGARIAQEKMGIPLATIVLQPTWFRSLHRMPVFAGAPPVPAWLPRPLKAALFWGVDVVADRLFHIGEINRFRAGLGLPRLRHIQGWWLSPQRVIGFFPDWFGLPQSDWPAQIRMPGFSMYDDRPPDAGLDPEVERFLASGSPPIAFTPGTGNMHAQAFFKAAVDACGLLGRRGMLLTRHTVQLPDRLPDSIRHFAYIPFSQVLPRVAALVHHGGVGTLAQGMAAGIPQLVMPMAFDQPDNAARLKKLGVGDWLAPKAFRAPEVARKLGRLLSSADVAERCRTLAGKVDDDDAIERACDMIEELMDEEPVATAPRTACATA